MGRYSSSFQRKVATRSEGPHVIWRGIGCLIMLIVPAISIAAGITTIKFGVAHNWAIPYQLLLAVRLPDFFYKSSGLIAIFYPLTQIPYLYAYLITSLLYILLIGGVISVIYAFIYRAIGPSRYGPLDEPPPRIKTKRYTR